MWYILHNLIDVCIVDCSIGVFYTIVVYNTVEMWILGSQLCWFAHMVKPLIVQSHIQLITRLLLISKKVNLFKSLDSIILISKLFQSLIVVG